MRLLLLSVVMFLSPLCIADSTHIYLDLKSHHFKPKPYYRENHDLFGIEHDRWLFVRFMNSESRKSTMIGRRVEWGNIGLITYGAKYGFVSGYNTKILGDFAPFALLSVVVDFGHVAVDFNILPTVVVGVGLRIDL